MPVTYLEVYNLYIFGLSYIGCFVIVEEGLKDG